jgi:GntR family transcriptional repressor for pyruvate dehydrogenase complex
MVQPVNDPMTTDDKNDKPGKQAVPDPSQTLATIAPVARSSVVDAVADKLRAEILSGRIPPGAKLPSERELSLALGVNRLTLRASLARLEALGLITTRHGAGTVVASWRERAGLDTLATLISSLTPADPTWYELTASTLEIRRILASEAIALAAARHDANDIETIVACQSVLQDHVDDALAYARADMAFMRAVVRTARNVGLELLLNTFARLPDDAPRFIESLYADRRESVKVYDVVVGLIKNGDADLARTTARRALEEMDRAWVQRHSPTTPTPPPAPKGAATSSSNKKRKKTT